MGSEKDKFDYDSIKAELEQSILAYLSAKGKKVSKVELDDEKFFDAVDYRIIKKDRDNNESVKEALSLSQDDFRKALISEQDTHFINLDQEVMNFDFTSSYEERSSFSIASSKGRSIGIGGNFGVGYEGTSAGINTGVQFRKSKTTTDGTSHAEIKTLKMSSKIRKNFTAIVKELVHEVPHYFNCEAELIVSDKHKVAYSKICEDGKEEQEEVEIKKLTFSSKMIRHENKHVIIFFKGPCKFQNVEHTLQVQQLSLGGKRRERIKLGEDDEYGTDPIDL